MIKCAYHAEEQKEVKINMESVNMAREFGEGLVKLSNIIDSQELLIAEFRLKAAMYKAYFFHKIDLAEKLEKQIEENLNASIGEFDGFCFASWRGMAVHRTLEDMVRQGIITESEYEFCKV